MGLNEFVKEELDKMDIFSEIEKKQKLLDLKEIIDGLANNYSLCLESCHLCNLKCVERKGHRSPNLKKKLDISAQIQTAREELSETELKIADEMEGTFEEIKQKKENIFRKNSLYF